MRCVHPLLVLLLLVGCGAGLPGSQPPVAPTPTPVLNLDDDDAADDDDVLDDDDAADDDDAGDDDDAVDDDDVLDDDDAADDDDATPDFEGDEPGECDDGADNDQDGLFDCDDPNCAGAPVCQGDDDDAADDDDASDDDDATPPPDDDDAADDDDATPPPDDDDAADDDDATSAPGAPIIQNVTVSWLTGVNEFDFEILVTDDDCNLGNPIIGWTLNGTPQAPLALSGNPVSCSATIHFYVPGLTPGQTYAFELTVTDSAGQTSLAWPISATAA